MNKALIGMLAVVSVFTFTVSFTWNSGLDTSPNGTINMEDTGFNASGVQEYVFNINLLFDPTKVVIIEEYVRRKGLMSNGEKRDARVLCWILTGPKNHMNKAIHVKRTWGSRCDKLLFMSSEKDDRLGSVALEGVEEGHDKLWPKTQKAFQYIWQHHRGEVDWILKADDDTYVLTDHLRDFLRNYNPAEAHYFGDVVQYGQGIPPINFGGSGEFNFQDSAQWDVGHDSVPNYYINVPGYVLSKEAARLLVEVALVQGGDCHPEIRRLYKGDEDTELGVCLAGVGVKAERTLDEHRRRRFNSGNPISDWKDMANDYENSWRNGPVCCSDTVVSFHYVTPSQMYMLEYLTQNLKSGHDE